MMRKACLIFACVLLASITISARSGHMSNADGTTVKIDSGQITGLTVGANNDVRAYRGIPFAAPPVGPLRWKAPQPVKAWKDVRACVEFGPSCPQPNRLELIYGMKLGPTSEDCLYLNVWTSAKKPSDKLPVMVWIHGGSYTMGAGSTPVYDGEALARQGVILVTINYRLGPFGWFAHPQLSKESEHNSSGNYGLLDQIAALEWVKRNIAAFGGDINRVTIFGESAGAGSVCYLMASPLARGLFQRAIAESGSGFGPNRNLRETWYGQEPAEKLGERITREMGADKSADPIAAMRAKSADEILHGANGPATALIGGGEGSRFAPIVDGWVITDEPLAVFAAGKQAKVPLITGTNSDEGSIFLLAIPINSVDGYKTLMRQVNGTYTNDVMALYPANDTGAVHSALDRFVTDMFFVSGSRYFARTTSKINPNTYMYEFSHVSSDPKRRMLGAFHASEIPYVFMTQDSGFAVYDDKDHELGRVMSAYWVQFARTGDPNGAGRPAWPKYDNASDKYMEFSDTIAVQSGLHKDAAELFERIAMEKHAKRQNTGER